MRRLDHRLPPGEVGVDPCAEVSRRIGDWLHQLRGEFVSDCRRRDGVADQLIDAVDFSRRQTGGTDQAKLADYLRSHTFHTLVGDIKFGPNGEWSEPRVLEVQFHDVKGHDLDQFRTMGTQTVLYPPALKTGTVKYPYSGGGQ